MDNRNQAFTIIELSIVLIVVGLLISGIVVGQNLIQSATSRAVIKEVQQYTALLNNFKEQYSFLPGDFPFATRIFGAGTNGNGDGRVQYGTENFQVWYHLVLARKLDANYDGSNEALSSVLNDSDTRIRVETNSSRIYNVLVNTRNSIGYHLANSSPNFISPIQAYDIDIKTDDGIPTSGSMMTYTNPATTCIKQADGITNALYTYTGGGSYNMQQSSNVCRRILFYLD
ncbi:MAG: type II secretion system protein [Alphaproteobacteria bacterium]